MTYVVSSVFVTGGSRGIGKALALRFAALGASSVAIGYMRSDTAAEETAEVLKVSAETVFRDWKLAKIWLLRELSRSDGI